MQPYRLFFVFLSACSAISRGQASGGVKTSEATLADGRVEFRVENVSNKSITAVAVEGRTTVASRGAKRGVAKTYLIQDSVIDPSTYPEVMPGGSSAFSLFGGKSDNDRQITVRAVLFSDGSSLGEAQWVNLLLRRRRVESEELERALQMINTAVLLGSSPEELVSQMRSAKTTRMGSVADIAERQIVDLVYGNLISNFEANPKVPMNPLARRITQDATVSLTRIKQSKPSFPPAAPAGQP
jgi:hypothetical protein